MLTVQIPPLFEASDQPPSSDVASTDETPSAVSWIASAVEPTPTAVAFALWSVPMADASALPPWTPSAAAVSPSPSAPAMLIPPPTALAAALLPSPPTASAVALPAMLPDVAMLLLPGPTFTVVVAFGTKIGDCTDPQSAVLMI